MSIFSDLVPIPPGTNSGLSACRERTMLDLFGQPGALADTCGTVTGAVRSRIRSGVDVGPFRVSGLDYAVESLAQVLREASQTHPELCGELCTAGMLCVRRIKHNPAHYSNHSWGTAIDLYFGNGVISQGKSLTQRGFLSLYPIFNRHGWFWGAGFSGDSVDSMHFELADETVHGAVAHFNVAGAVIPAADYIRLSGLDRVSELI